MATWMCSHSCHQQQKGDYESAKQLGQWQSAILASHDPLINAVVPVDASDPIEAAVAQGCSCIGNHIHALSDAPPPFLPPQDWTPDATGDSD